MLSGKATFTISPTEDKEKLTRAVSRFFPQELSTREAFSKFREAIFSRRIIDTARSRLLANVRGETTFLLLHKQALLAGKLSIVDSEKESSLGAIRLEIHSDDIKQFIGWLSPETKEGVPIQ